MLSGKPALGKPKPDHGYKPFLVRSPQPKAVSGQSSSRALAAIRSQSAVSSFGVAFLDENQVIALLVRRCVGGDAAAWEEIVQRFHRRIYNVCYRFAGDPDSAQDLTQEAFIKMYRTLATYDSSKGAFMTWVTTITRNLLVDHFRKTKGDRLTDSLDAPMSEHEDALPLSDQIADRGPSPDSRAQSRETGEMVHGALQKLSPELREAVILRDLQDMDYREIATVLRVPEGTVKSRINRGRAELARLLQRTYKQVI